MDHKYLLRCCEVQSEWYRRLLALSLELFPNYEVTIIVEDKLVWKIVEEKIIVQKLFTPW